MWGLYGDRWVQGGDPRAGEADLTLGISSGWQKIQGGQLDLWTRYSQVCLPGMTRPVGQIHLLLQARYCWVFLSQMVMSACLEELDMDRPQIAESMGLDLWASGFACLTWPDVQVQ